jgi:hypothetical protein
LTPMPRDIGASGPSINLAKQRPVSPEEVQQ